MNIDLKNKNAVVCGSSSGLGLASAVELSRLGANVILLARNEIKLKSAIAKLDAQQGQKHRYAVADFTQPQQVKETITKIVSETPVHILINNTGGPAGGQILDASSEDFLNALNSHLICNQILVQAVVPGMKEAAFGRIVNITSISVKEPIPGLGVSNTTRGAVASWAKTLAGEVGPFGITVNNVLPGYTRTARIDSLWQKQSEQTGASVASIEAKMTAQIPLRRVGTPEDFGAVVAFLCTPSAGYITGANIPVDGGIIRSL